MEQAFIHITVSLTVTADGKYEFDSIGVLMCDFSNNCSFSLSFLDKAAISSEADRNSVNVTDSINSISNNEMQTVEIPAPGIVTQENKSQHDYSNFQTYNNPDFGLRIDYPFGWTVERSDIEDTDFKINIISPEDGLEDKDAEVVSIQLRTIPYEGLIAEPHTIAEEFIRLANQTYDEYQLLESGPKMLGGMQGHKVVETSKVFDRYLKTMSIYASKEDGQQIIQYLVQYSAGLEDYERYLPISEKVIDSLEVYDVKPSSKMELFNRLV